MKPKKGTKKALAQQASGKAPPEKMQPKANEKPNEGTGKPVLPNIEAEQKQPDAEQANKAPFKFEVEGWEGQIFPTAGKTICVLMPEDIAKHHGDPENPDAPSYSAIQKRFQSDLDWLIQKAIKGEWDAIKIMAEMGIDAAAALGSLVNLQHPTVKRVGRTFIEWPMVISPEPDHPQNANLLREFIELGKEIAVRDDKILHKKKRLLQREVIFHALKLFLSARKSAAHLAKEQRFKRILSQFAAIETSNEDTDTHAALARSIAPLSGELKRANEGARDAINAIKFHRKQLRSCLNGTPSDLWTQRIWDASLKAGELPSLSSSTRDPWFDALLELIKAIIDTELEENEVLRTLGDSRGDVEIRKHAKTDNPDEFKRLKIELRHDPGVNGAIRSRIKDKLSDAFDVFVSETER